AATAHPQYHHRSREADRQPGPQNRPHPQGSGKAGQGRGRGCLNLWVVGARSSPYKTFTTPASQPNKRPVTRRVFLFPCKPVIISSSVRPFFKALRTDPSLFTAQGATVVPSPTTPFHESSHLCLTRFPSLT